MSLDPGVQKLINPIEFRLSKQKITWTFALCCAPQPPFENMVQKCLVWFWQGSLLLKVSHGYVSLRW